MRLIDADALCNALYKEYWDGSDKSNNAIEPNSRYEKYEFARGVVWDAPTVNIDCKNIKSEILEVLQKY